MTIMCKLLVPLLVVGALLVNPSQAVEAEVRNEREWESESEIGSESYQMFPFYCLINTRKCAIE
jgi:hypothetical protein